MFTGLKDLIGDVSEEQFFSEIFEKRYFKFNAKPEFGKNLFSSECLEQYLFTATPWMVDNAWGDGGLLAAKAPNGYRKPAVSSAEEALGLYANGETLIMPAVHRRWAPLTEYCACLAESMLSRIEANVYLTPAKSQGFLAHYDNHDVILLQIEGCKTWKLRADDRISLPPGEENFREEFYEIDRAQDILGAEEIVLNAGECIYIPRGVIHEGIAQTSSHSLHITFGFHPVTWYTLLRGMIFEAMIKDESLRKCVPHDILCDLGANSEKISEIAANAIRKSDANGSYRFLYDRTGGIVPGGAIRSINAVNDVTEKTKLRIKAGCSFFWSESGRVPWVTVTGRRIRIPEKTLPMFDFVSTREEFTPEELPNDLPGESRITFSKWLITQGIAVIQ